MAVTLSEIAAGIEVTEEQRDRGVASVDDTDADLAERLEPCAEALPCDPAAAATAAEAYLAGAAVGEAGHEAGIAPITAAKVLHLSGVEGVSPLAPEARRVVRDWLDGRLARTEARTLTGASEVEFVLGAYVERVDQVPAAVEAVAAARTADGDAAVRKRDHLAATMSAATDRR